MTRSSQGFVWLVAVSLIAACYLLADLWGSRLAKRGLEVAAEVQGRPITRQELEEAMREDLWKRDEVWTSLSAESRKETRWRVQEDLLNNRLVRIARGTSRPAVEVDKAGVKSEAERMQRQFAEAGEFSRRLLAQQLTLKELDARILETQLDEAWIDQQIQPQLRKVSEQEVRSWYEYYKDDLRIPQTVHAAHLFLTRHDKAKPDREAEMREIQRQLLAKEKTFAQLVKEHSEDARSRALGGDLGWFTAGRMPADFMVAVEKLQVGQVSERVQTRLGWHLILVLERRAARQPTFEEAKVEISALLLGRSREDAVEKLIKELRERESEAVVYHAEVIDRAEPAP